MPKRFKDLGAHIVDCFEWGEKVSAEIEKAYRRGFHQGAAQAFYAMQEGVTEHRIEKWVERTYSWRLRGSEWRSGQKVKPEFPPVCRRPERRGG